MTRLSLLTSCLAFLVPCAIANAQWWWPPADFNATASCNPGGAATITVGGQWPDSCIPQTSAIRLTPAGIEFDVNWNYPAGTGCLTVIRPWSRTNTIRGLANGTYQVNARLLENGTQVFRTEPVGTVTINCPCVADTDNGSGTGTPDGGVGIEDLLYYLDQYDAGTVRADVDDGSGTGTRDGGVGIEDLLYFLGRYDAGC